MRSPVGGRGAERPAELQLGHGRLRPACAPRAGCWRRVRLMGAIPWLSMTSRQASGTGAHRLWEPLQWGPSSGPAAASDGRGDHAREDDSEAGKIMVCEPCIGASFGPRCRAMRSHDNFGQGSSWSKVSVPLGLPRWGTGRLSRPATSVSIPRCCWVRCELLPLRTHSVSRPPGHRSGSSLLHDCLRQSRRRGFGAAKRPRGLPCRGT